MRKTAPKGWICLTEFESLTGINKKTITAAISRGAIPERYADQVGDTAKAPYYLNPLQAAIHWHKELHPNHASQKKLRGALEDYIKSVKPEAVPKPPKTKTTGEITAANAYDRKQIAEAELAELKLKQLRGELLPRSKVEDQLFTAGKQIREDIMRVPDRITDEVCAYADDRNRVRAIIDEALSMALRTLATKIIK
ncbi:MAG: hypothetical protein LUD76_10130 [Alistipes sp.]|nr:hypothetical protein [Alistipes sp.]